MPSLTDFKYDCKDENENSIILNTPIHIDEDYQSITKLKQVNRKAQMASGQSFTNIHVPIFNSILSSGVFPDSIIVTVYKSGSRNDLATYREIYVLNVLKYFKLCYFKWAEMCNKIYEAQAGFRAGSSCTDNMFTLQSLKIY